MGGPVETEVVRTPVTAGRRAVPARPERFPCFDGLRAIAAFSVFAYHSYGVLFREDRDFLPVSVEGWLEPLGRLGVAIFFVISGFLLFRPYALAMLEGRPLPRLGPFWKRRFFRIFPAYWVALAVVVFVAGQETFPNLGDGVSAFALVHSYRYGYSALGLGVAWTLVIEVSFYIVLPLFAAVLRAGIGSLADPRRTVRIQVAVLVVVGALGLLVRYVYYFHRPLGGPPTRGAWFDLNALVVWLPSYLDWFAFGMLLAVGSAWLLGGGRVPKIADGLGGMAGLSWLLALECYWIVVQAGLPVKPTLTLVSSGQATVSYAFSGLCAAFLVLPAVFGPQDVGPVRRLLRTRPLVALGIVSYGFYLWHVPVWVQAEAWGVDSLPMVVQVVVVFVAAVGIAAASWFVVERPIIRWSSRRRAPAIAPSPGAPVLGPARAVGSAATGSGNGAGPAATPARTAKPPVLAAVVVALALLALVVGSLDLDPAPVLGAKDSFAFAGRSGLVRDDFDRVDPTGLGTATTGQRWEELSGRWSVANGQANVGPEGGLAVLRVAARHARTVGGGLAFRVASVRNYWSVEPVPHFHTWNVERVVNGQKLFVKNLGNIGVKPTSTVSVHLDGDHIAIAIDGTLRYTADDPILQRATGVGLVRLPGRATTPWTSFVASR